MALVQYNSVFIPLCSPNTCKDVFNPNVTAFQSNCADGLHFSAFHCFKWPTELKGQDCDGRGVRFYCFKGLRELRGQEFRLKGIF